MGITGGLRPLIQDREVPKVLFINKMYLISLSKDLYTFAKRRTGEEGRKKISPEQFFKTILEILQNFCHFPTKFFKKLLKTFL